MQIEAIDASTGRKFTGKLIKRYPQGVTIDDARDVRHYVMYERVLTPLDTADRAPIPPGYNGQGLLI